MIWCMTTRTYIISIVHTYMHTYVHTYKYFSTLVFNNDVCMYVWVAFRIRRRDEGLAVHRLNEKNIPYRLSGSRLRCGR